MGHIRAQAEKIEQLAKGYQEDNSALRSVQLVLEFFKGDEQKTWLWFRAENPLLGNISPNRMIELGRSKYLLKFIENAKEENVWID